MRLLVRFLIGAALLVAILTFTTGATAFVLSAAVIVVGVGPLRLLRLVFGLLMIMRALG